MGAFRHLRLCGKGVYIRIMQYGGAESKTALVLVSGGLDSVLAAKLLMHCGINVLGITFHTPFFGGDKARRSAELAGIDCREADITAPHLEMLQAPRYGYGRNMNPCIDCHILMVAEAYARMESWGADFLATGEVLGERPMSQNRAALDLVAKRSGAEGYLLRPLSAKLLEPTIHERMGLVPREALLDISGRGRRRQMELAARWGIHEYQTPAGGCILTDKIFSQRLRDLMEMATSFAEGDIELLKKGRHFKSGAVKIVVGRNSRENECLERLAGPGDTLMWERAHPGPTALLRSYGDHIDEAALAEASRLVGRYGKSKRPAGLAEMNIFRMDEQARRTERPPATSTVFKPT